MSSDRAVFVILFRVIFLAALGAIVLTFAAAIFSVIGFLLLAALVGFIVWMPVHSYFCGRRRQWQRRWEQAKALGSKAFRRCLPAAEAGKEWIDQTGVRLRSTIYRIGIVMLEMLSGASIGCLIVLLRSEEVAVLPMLLGIGGGALLGAMIGLSCKPARPDAERKPVTETPSSH